MQCDICSRTGGAKLPFLCPTDARNQLYHLRIKQAHVLIGNESLERQVNAITTKTAVDDKAAAIKTTANAWDVDVATAEKEAALDRTQQIIAAAADLRKKVDAARAEISRRKAILSRRKTELSSAQNGVEARRSRALEEATQMRKIKQYKWDQQHATTASSRAFLCSEAAKLYGLRRHQDSDLWHEDFGIGGVGIMDLRAMNSASPAQITTALGHIAHLLVLSTHYLGIRLPAEVTLPHRDYPLPTVFVIGASHKGYEVPFPGSGIGQSGNNSPSASRHDELKDQPRPRPLFITKPLPLLAKEDPSTYSLFIEGTTLLAYNVAWVCRSQGVLVGEKSSFEDICDIGRNFHDLLIGSRQRPSLPNIRAPSAAPSATASPAKVNLSSSPPEADISEKVPAMSMIGEYSHSTAHTFLGGAVGTDFIRSWKLSSPMKLADQLKAHLLAELNNAEWEVLDQDAWAEEEDEGVLVGGRKREGRGMVLAAQSFMSMRTVMDSKDDAGRERDRKPGTSGWTKVKPRGGEKI